MTKDRGDHDHDRDGITTGTAAITTTGTTVVTATIGRPARQRLASRSRLAPR